MDVHPFLVHFPIVLVLAGLASDLAGLFSGRAVLLRTGACLFTAGALFALAAAYTGEVAAERARRIAGIAADLDRHEELSTWAAWLAVGLALLRLRALLLRRFAGGLRAAWIAAAAACAALVVASAYTGGRLVYRHGAGTRPVYEALPPSAADSASDRSRVTEFRSRELRSEPVRRPDPKAEPAGSAREAPR